MNRNVGLGLFRFLDVIVILTMLFGGPMNVYAAPQPQDAPPDLTIDKTDYALGDVAHITGSNFTTGDYLLRALGPDTTVADWGTATASDSGGFTSDSPQLGAPGSYELRAYPAGWSGDWNEVPVASITFTVTAPAPTTEPTAAPTETATATPAPAPYVQSDKDDYFAGETVTLTSKNWQPNESVHLLVNDVIGDSWKLSDDVTADAAGAFTYQFSLPNWFVAQYHVYAYGALSGATTADFTDSQPSTITLSPASVTVLPGGSAVYGVTVTKAGNNNSCSITLSVTTALPTGASASFDSPNPFTMTNADVSKTLTITTTNTGPQAGRTPTGTYPFTVQAARGAGCQGNGNITTDGTLIVGFPNVATSLALSAPNPASVTFGSTGPVSISATLTETSGGAAISGATVGFSVDGTSVGTATTNASGVATFSTYNPSALASGSHTVQASFAGQTLNSKAYTASTSGTQTLTVNKVTPVITFGPAPAPTYLGGDFTVSATTTNTDSSALTYSYVSGPCAFVSGATFSSSGAGTCVVKASGAETTNFSAASAQQSVTIAKAAGSITISNIPASAAYGGSFTATYTVSGDGTPSVTSSTPSACTVSGNLVNYVGVGSCTLTAHVTAGTNYLAADGAPQSFTIGKANQTISFGALSDKSYGDADFAVSATASSGLAVTFAASGNCTVTGTSVHITGAGSCTISAQQAGNANYNPATDVPQSFNIGKATPVITWNNPSSIVYGTALSNTQLNATASVPGTFVYSPAAGTVLNAGSGQTLHVDFTPTDAANYGTASKDVTIDVSKAPSTVIVTFESGPYTYRGSAFTATANATGAGGLNQAVAVVYSGDCQNVTSANGCTATATFAGDNNHTGNSDSKSITITQASSTTLVSCPSTAQTYTGSAIEPCTASYATEDGLSGSLSISYAANVNVGTATANASYAGDGNHQGSSNLATFEIGKASSTVIVSCPLATQTYTGSAIEPCTASYSGAGGLSGSLTPTYSANVNAGTATANATYAGDANHEGSSNSATFEIGKASSTVTVSCPATAQTYTGSAIEPCTASYSTEDGLSGTLTLTYSANINVGTATANASYAGDGNHQGNSNSATFDIKKALSTVTVSCPAAALTYTGSAIEPCTASYSTEDGLSGSLTPVYSDNTNVGTATANATYAGDANHEGSSNSATFDIKKALSTVTVSCPAAALTYTGSAIEPCTASYSTEDGLSGSLTPTYSANINVGTATANASYAGDGNHEGSNNSATFDIKKALSTVTVSCPAAALTYTGSAIEPCTASYSTEDGLSGSLTPVYSDNINVGTATANASYAGDGNHEGSSNSATFDIKKALSTVSVSCPATALTYTAYAIEPCTASYSTEDGLSGPLTPTYLDNVSVGTATANATYAGDGNHEGSSGLANFEISKATLTVTADHKTKTYGDANPSLTFAYNGFLGADNASVLNTEPSCSTTATQSSSVGSYPITCSNGDDNNYAFDYVDNTLDVGKANLTVTADDKSRTYGAANPAFTASYSGFKNGETLATSGVTGAPSLTTLANTGSPVPGPYTITAAIGTLDSGNYSFTFVDGNLTITQAPLTITADNKSKVYGSANPTLTASYGGFVNGDTPASLDTPVSLSTTATLGSNVGTYPIVPSGAADANYAITFVNGTLAVTQAPLTITADDKSKVYGSANPTLTASYSGFVNGDTFASLDTPVSLSTTATAASIVGAYPITAGGASGSNYAITFVPGTLTVTKAALTITADNKSKVYGSANPTLTASYSGFVNGDTPASLDTPVSLATTATALSIVGAYPITPSGAADANYAITFVNGTLTVTKALLTVTAVDKSKILNAPNPAFTFVITGFKNSETVSVLTTQPTCVSTATTNSPVGSYPISCSGAAAANYDFTYVSGTLKIMFATNAMCMGEAGHQVLQPVNADGSSAWKARNTIPIKFRICDANGVSIGGSISAVFDTIPTAGIAAPYLYQAISGSPSVDETALSGTPDPQFRWDATAQQWIFNLNTSNLSANNSYYYHIYLKDGSTIDFKFGLK